MNPDLPKGQVWESADEAEASFPDESVAVLDDIDRARADEYALLASLLMAPPDGDLLAQLSQIKDIGDTHLGSAHNALAQAASSSSPEAIKREYFDLFIGVGRGELVPYASYYLTGFLNEKPLARLRGDMKLFGIQRADGNCEPEDHIGSVCEMMSGFASNRFPVSAIQEREFFQRHVEPWAGRFFSNLENAKAAQFYRTLGSIGRLFMDIETEAFAMEARQSA